MALDIDFCIPGSGGVGSMILSGDNGSGKSSIVDAFEYVLQGRIGRRVKINSGSAPHAVSLAGGGRAIISMAFTDGSEFKRSIDVDPTGATSKSSTAPHPGFAISPFVLRRSDILQFWDTEEHKRQIIFFDFLRDPSSGGGTDKDLEWDESSRELQRDIESRRVALKNERRSIRDQLALCLGISANQIPMGSGDFNAFANEYVYGGLNKKQRATLQRRGVRLKHSPVAEDLIKKLVSLDLELKQLRGQLKSDSGVHVPVTNKRAIKEVFERAGDRITKAFAEISPSSGFVSSIQMTSGKVTDVALVVRVHTKNRRVVDPVNVFSEANLDLLALLIILAIIQESARVGQAKLLVLDDVLQSVDAAYRLQVAEHILHEFGDWQIVFTVHDRLWQEQLRDIFRRHNHAFVEREIVRWDYERGPLVIEVQRDADMLLREAMTRGDIISICSHGGILLEKICHDLSFILPISVTRRKGDKYTLGDLWPGIRKGLRKTNLSKVVDDVDRWLHLRNLVGAHYNEWALTLSRQEAHLFGEAVLSLYTNYFCSACNRQIENVSAVGKTAVYACRCGGLRIEDAVSTAGVEK